MSTSLARYATTGAGTTPYGELTAADRAAMQARLALRSEDPAKVGTALGSRDRTGEF